MKHASIILALLSVLFAAPAAGAGEGRVLYVFTWADYFDPGEVRAFEEKNACRVEFEHYDSNETMFETLSAGSGYDVITPTPNSAVSLREMGALADLDHSLLPNLANLDKESAGLSLDPEMTYSLPYTVTVTGIGYNRTLVPEEDLGSWSLFADSALGKKTAMLNDMREVIGAALKYLGYPLNTTDPAHIRAAVDTVRQWKRNIVMFDVDRAKAGLRDGKLVAIQAYNGDVANIMPDNPDIAFFVPKEGSAINADVFTISADSENRDLAHAFINHFLDAEVALKNMLTVRFYMPNLPALDKMPLETKRQIALDVPKEVIDKCEMLRSVGANRDVYDRAWEEILIGD